MARAFYVNGESLILVKSRSDSAIATLSELGLTEGPVRITPELRHRDISPDAWGGEIPIDTQWMNGAFQITTDLIHYDAAVLDECLRLSMGNATAVGTVGRAGIRLGGGVARFAVGNNLIGLNLSSPIAGKPYRFYHTYLTGNPVEIPLGTRRS